MKKPTIAQLLKASGHDTFTPELIKQASQLLYGNIGAGLDQRNWQIILDSDDPLAAAAQGLKSLYQDSEFLLNNANHLQNKGYSAAQIESTYRQLQERVGYEYTSKAWAEGTQFEAATLMTDAELASQIERENADTTAPAAPIINAVSADDIINATESTNGFNLTGTGEVGATVTVTGFATANKTATVQADGSWTIAVADVDLTDNTTTTLSATQADVAGNTSTAATRDITVDTVAAVPVINAVSTDDIIKATESTAGFNLTGTGEVGAKVTVTGFVTANKIATVQGDGTWTIAIVDGDLTDNTTTTLSATQTDVAGNTSTAATRAITVDTVAAAPAINAVSTDDIINATESTNGFNLTGTGEVGATVTVTGFATADKTATVQADNTWTIAVADGDLTDNTTTTLSATQTDVAGNTSAAATRAITVDTVAAAPAINAVSTDNIINATESTTGFNLTGTGEVGATVTVTGFATADKTATVQADGSWTMVIADVDLTDNTTTTLSATQTDVAGNTSTAATRAIAVDTVAPTITVAPAVASETTISLTADENSVVGIYDSASALIGSTTSLTANTQGTISVAAQAVPKTGNIVVTDAAGNATTSAVSVVLGTAGDDLTLSGDASSNIILGFAGTNSMTGNGGSDTFLFDDRPSAATTIDTITDFGAGAGNDVLDFIQLEYSLSNAGNPYELGGAGAAKVLGAGAEVHLVFDGVMGTLTGTNFGTGAGQLDAGTNTALDFLVLLGATATDTTLDLYRVAGRTDGNNGATSDIDIFLIGTINTADGSTLSDFAAGNFA